MLTGLTLPELSMVLHVIRVVLQHYIHQLNAILRVLQDFQFHFEIGLHCIVLQYQNNIRQ